MFDVWELFRFFAFSTFSSWHGTKNPDIWKEIAINLQFERMNLKLQTTKKMLTQTIFKATFHKSFNFGWDILKSWICVESENLPGGPAMTNERGECCAPFTFKNTQNYIFDWISMSGSFLGFLHFCQFWGHVAPKTGTILQQMFIKITFAQLNPKLQILENLLVQMILENTFDFRFKI